jgi:hypothetical protein
MTDQNKVLSFSFQKKLFFRPYWGYGDWISVNGMVRFFSSKYDEVNLVIDGSNINFVKNLYKDDPKIKLIHSNQVVLNNQIDDYLNLEIWEQKKEDIPKNFYNRFKQIGKKFNLDVISVDDDCYTIIKSPHKFTEKCKFIMEDNASAFYIAAGIPKEYKLDKFYYERDFQSEDTFFENLNLPDDYIVVCEYESNLIDRKYIENKQLKIVNINNISEKYFDIIKIIENAKEIHLIENSIALLVYHLQYKNLMKNVPINMHTYSRKEEIRRCHSSELSNLYLDMFMHPCLKNWNFIYKND